VENPLTPTGVEHLTDPGDLVVDPFVENPLTPTGVEHAKVMSDNEKGDLWRIL